MAEWSKAPDSRCFFLLIVGECSGPRMRAWVRIPLLTLFCYEQLCVSCIILGSLFGTTSSSRFYGVMVSTLDSESSDPSSNLGRTYFFFWWLKIVADEKFYRPTTIQNWRYRELNPGPHTCEACALPLSYIPDWVSNVALSFSNAMPVIMHKLIGDVFEGFQLGTWKNWIF